MRRNTVIKLILTNFTAFKEVEFQFSPGINLFIGQNGTGKTHILKLIYSILSASKTGIRIADKINNVFLPYENRLGRLVHRQKKSTRAKIRLFRSPSHRLSLLFTNHSKEALKIYKSQQWENEIKPCVYIPVKEMLANAPGFRSLYEMREIEFEEVYADIVDKAYLPVLRKKRDDKKTELLQIIETIIKGKVHCKNERFFLKNRQGELEFTLLAEGMRKLALIWLLIQNGTLNPGSTLFWDEPETNLNPSNIQTIVEILLSLQRSGVQIFLATHNYVLLKSFDLLKRKGDEIKYFSLYRSRDEQEVLCKDFSDLIDLEPNEITDTYLSLYDQQIESATRGIRK